MRKLILYCFLISVPALYSCNDDDDRERVPEVHVNRSINLNNPSYSDLNPMGGFVYLDEGYRGIILMHAFDGSYIAFERACTYHPHYDCASVTVRKSRIEIGCGQYETPAGEEDEQWVECCGSHYQTDGNVVNGPARYPLKQYQVHREGSILLISN